MLISNNNFPITYVAIAVISIRVKTLKKTPSMQESLQQNSSIKLMQN